MPPQQMQPPQMPSQGQPQGQAQQPIQAQHPNQHQDPNNEMKLLIAFLQELDNRVTALEEKGGGPNPALNQ